MGHSAAARIRPIENSSDLIENQTRVLPACSIVRQPTTLPHSPTKTLYLLNLIHLKVKMYRTLILPVLLYGCETWSPTLREERRLRVFENRVLRRIFGLKRDKVTGDWIKLRNAELHNVYSLPNIVRMIKPRIMRLAKCVGRKGKKNIQNLDGKSWKKEITRNT
jgi:hypothetical protein